MKRNIVICLLLCFTFFFTAGCAKKDKGNELSPEENTTVNEQSSDESTDEDEFVDYFKLNVNGIYLADVPSFKGIIYFDEEHQYPDNYEYIPFTDTMRALGATFEWQNETTAKMKYNGKTYTLDTKQATLYRDDYEFSLITPMPGGKMHHKGIGEDFALDNGTFYGFFQLEHFDVRVIVSPDDKTVNVG